MSSQEIVLIADEKVLAIPIQEKGEALFDLRNQSEILIGPSPEIENNPCYTKVRASVFEMLKKAQGLLPKALKLCLYEGLRSFSLQAQLFEQRKKMVQQLHPKWSDSEIYYEVIKLVSPLVTLNGEKNIPPHATGAAVDVYLVDSQTHLPVDMGILTKDWMQDTEGLLSQTDSELISDEARKNRKILNEIMTEVGFANYPTEYWHWSYGDRYWAFVKKQAKAFYGPLE